MRQDAADSRLTALEASLRAILHEARLAQGALCANEVLVRLENIARLAEGTLNAPMTEDRPGGTGPS